MWNFLGIYLNLIYNCSQKRFRHYTILTSKLHNFNKCIRINRSVLYYVTVFSVKVYTYLHILHKYLYIKRTIFKKILLIWGFMRLLSCSRITIQSIRYGLYKNLFFVIVHMFYMFLILNPTKHVSEELDCRINRMLEMSIEQWKKRMEEFERRMETSHCWLFK